MTEQVYASGRALWQAVAERARATARDSGRPPSEYVRRFVFSRFLARVFAEPDSPWVLKGGTAVLVRVHDARHSKDIDLMHSLGNLDDAVDALRAALTPDLGDHFRFVVLSVRDAGDTDQQPYVNGARVAIEAYCGNSKVDAFGVDLVTGSLMTTAPDVEPSNPPLTLPGIAAPLVRLYPVVDHVADKVCATETTYGNGRGSSRPRDLVDLVIFARTQRIDGTALHEAIRAERAIRHLPARTHFTVPGAWESTYPPLARQTPPSADLTTTAAAVRLVAGMLDPAMTADSIGQTWDPATAKWVPGT